MKDTATYGLAEAARYLKIAPATLRTWVLGRSYPRRSGIGHFKPLIALPDTEQALLSFNNLIEAYVLRALRQEHGVSIRAVRTALDFAESQCKIPRLLLSPDLLTAAGDLFLQRYGELINLSRSGQLAMRKMLEAHLKRIDRDEEWPVRLYPFIEHDRHKKIVIDPHMKFGRPFILRQGISTAIIVDRIDAGEAPAVLADDYDLTLDEIELAVLYERAA